MQGKRDNVAFAVIPGIKLSCEMMLMLVSADKQHEPAIAPQLDLYLALFHRLEVEQQTPVEG